MYGSETWQMGISADAKHFLGQFKVIRGHPRSNLYDLTWMWNLVSGDNVLWRKCCEVSSRSNPYTLSYGGETWVVERCFDAKKFEGQFKSSGVNPNIKWGQTRIFCRMEAKLGGWGYCPMLTILEVNSRSSGVNQRSNLYSLSYGSETWWVGMSSDANNFGGQFKVNQRSNIYICRMEVKLGGWGYHPMPNIF